MKISPQLKRTITILVLNLSNHSGSLVAYWPKFMRKHNTAILSCELSGDVVCCKPSPGKSEVESASREQCPLGVAGTECSGFYNPAAGQEAGGAGQGWGMQVSPDDSRVTHMKWTVPM